MTREQAIRKRERLAAQLSSPISVLRGSLLQRTLRHSSGCLKCARGEGHPLAVLNVGYPGGKTRQVSLRTTAVDGATVITDRYEVLAFGAKIVRRDGSSQVTEVVLTEPIEGAGAEVVEPGQLGGTRHLSAAQFIRDQHDAVALVASQDGRFTVFAWSPCENMVHAHRIETLLL